MRTLAFAIACCLVGGAVAQVFGPPVIDRVSNDGAYQITFISDHAAPAAGEISEWRLWAGGLGQVNLQMWRPISGGFQLVGYNVVDVSSLGFNTFAVSSGRIAVQAGDVIGFRYNQTSQGTRPIDYDSNAGGHYQWTNWPDPNTDVPVGGVIQSSALTGLGEGREYSLAATVSPVPEPGTVAILGFGLWVLRSRARRRTNSCS